MKTLYIFDADGTLIDRDSGEWLPNTLSTIDSLEDCEIAIATNQGGPACRDAGWPWSDKYPTLQQVEKRYGKIANAIKARLYMSLLFIDKNGNHHLPGAISTADVRSIPAMRKPCAGMLEFAMRELGSDCENTVMVGDSEDDKKASLAAGVKFIDANEFFGRVG